MILVLEVFGLYLNVDIIKDMNGIILILYLLLFVLLDVIGKNGLFFLINSLVYLF